MRYAASMAINLKSDEMLDGVPLRERYERFCVRFVETRNAPHAFRTAFVVDKGKLGDWVQEQARKLLTDESIAARIQELRDAAATAQLTGVLELMQDYHDIIVADPNEIISYVRENCRHCYGEGHAYQWKNEQEYIDECERINRENLHVPPARQAPLPAFDGGIGFDPLREPNVLCPACFGQGIGRTVLHDTRKLSPQARKLYEGVKETTSGIEIKMADKGKAREALGRMLGAFKDGIPIIPTQPNKAEPEKPITKENAQRTYLDLITQPAAGNVVVPFKKSG